MIVLALPLLVLAAGALAPDPLDVELLTDAATPGTRIRLYDVVGAEARELLSDELLDVDLGRSPSPSAGRLLTRRAIELSLPENSVRLVGADGVTVRTLTRRVDPDEVVAEARKYLVRELGLSNDVEIDVSKHPFEAEVPRGRETFELKPRFRSRPVGAGAIGVLVDVVVDDKLQVVLPTAFLVRTYATHPVLARTLKRGERLTPEHVRTARVETTSRFGVAAAADATELIGRVARRSLTIGDVLQERDFELPILVRRGEAVTMVFARGALRVEAFGLARDDGILGATIRVENLMTQRKLVGRVVGNGLVQLNP